MTTPETLLSDLYHALRNPRRRYVIRILNEAQQETFTTRELAREITSIEHGIPKEQATGESYRNVYNALSQTHLPTLSDADIIVYDSTRQIVSPDQYLKLAALLLDNNTPLVKFFSKLCSTGPDSGEQ
jgi:tyrosyl-tRNA synthetase